MTPLMQVATGVVWAAAVVGVVVFLRGCRQADDSGAVLGWPAPKGEGSDQPISSESAIRYVRRPRDVGSREAMVHPSPMGRDIDEGSVPAAAAAPARADIASEGAVHG